MSPRASTRPDKPDRLRATRIIARATQPLYRATFALYRRLASRYVFAGIYLRIRGREVSRFCAPAISSPARVCKTANAEEIETRNDTRIAMQVAI